MINWNIVLVVPLENEDVTSPPIPITNVVFPRDVLSGDLFTLSLNPVPWELRRYAGYMLSKPICMKIAHSFFMDDLETNSKSIIDINLLSDIKNLHQINNRHRFTVRY